MRKLWVVGLVVVIALLLFNISSVNPSDNNYTHEVAVYDYNSGDLLIWSGADFNAHDNKWDMAFFVTIDGTLYDFRLITTNTQYDKVWIDRTYRTGLYVEVSGPSGENGSLELDVPQTLVAYPENLKAYVDNQPIEFTIENFVPPSNNPEVSYGLYYRIRAELHFSTHMLMVDFGPKATTGGAPSEQLPWSAIAIGGVIAAVAVLGAIYWLKFRK